MLAKHHLNKTTVDQPPRPASPSEEKEESTVRLYQVSVPEDGVLSLGERTYKVSSLRQGPG